MAGLYDPEAAWVSGKCSPLRWRTLPGDVIEIEGRGVPKTKAWPKAVETWRGLIFAAADRFDVPAHWIAGIMALESGGSPLLESPAGAAGLMQLMPTTAAYLAKLEGLPPPNHDDVLRPEINIRLGVRYMRDLLKKFDRQYPLVGAAYNAGDVYCGTGCAVRDKATKTCLQDCPPNEWGMRMDCWKQKSGEWASSNYPTRIIEYANGALEHGFDPASKPLIVPPLVVPDRVPEPGAPDAPEASIGASTHFFAAVVGAALGAAAIVLYTDPKLRRRARAVFA